MATTEQGLSGGAEREEHTPPTASTGHSPQPGQTGQRPLIPRAMLFGNPERANPQLSPDGQHLAYLAPDERGVLQVWLRPVGATGEAGQARVLTADKKRGIHGYFWTYRPGQLAYWQDSDGDENFHLYAVDVTRDTVRDMTPFLGIRGQLVTRDPATPDTLLVAMNVLDRRRHDVYRLSLDTGALELDTTNPGIVLAWTADAQLRVLGATASTADGGSQLWLRAAPDQPWRTVREWGPDDEGSAIGFSSDGATLYLLGSHGANAKRLLALEIATGRETVVAENPQYDVGAVFFHPVRRVPQAVAFNRDRLHWQVLDPEIVDDFAALAAVGDGDFSVVSRDLADTLWLVGYNVDVAPAAFYLYDRRTKLATFLFTTRPQLGEYTFAPMQPLTYQARDGLTLHGYLTPPPGVPAHDLPTVVLVHGGPWGRDLWGFSTWPQWLANRGYAVLQVNFRGSTGYGKAFTNAGDREWGGAMHDDVVDGTRWLIAQGVADAQRIAIMGISYGGYATLAGLAFTPDLFACGVDLVGPSNLVTLINSIPPYWRPMRARLVKRMGDPERDEAFLKSRSPLFFADRITAPLLIGQGTNDARVPQRESDQIVEALRRAGKPVEYIVFSDEGHGFARPENNRYFFARAEQFLAKHLGGQCERLDNVTGHSGTDR